jgi:hypothetical protein
MSRQDKIKDTLLEVGLCDRIRDCLLDYVHKDELQGVINHLNHYIWRYFKIAVVFGMVIGSFATIIFLKWLS